MKFFCQAKESTFTMSTHQWWQQSEIGCAIHKIRQRYWLRKIYLLLTHDSKIRCANVVPAHLAPPYLSYHCFFLQSFETCSSSLVNLFLFSFSGFPFPYHIKVILMFILTLSTVKAGSSIPSPEMVLTHRGELNNTLLEITVPEASISLAVVRYHF